MDSGDSFQLIILVILLMLSAFFSSNETALMSVSKLKLRTLADSGNKRAAMVLDVTENHTSKMLSAILIGNNIVNLSASALATSLAYAFGGYMVSIATARDHAKELCNNKCRKTGAQIYRGHPFLYGCHDARDLYH